MINREYGVRIDGENFQHFGGFAGARDWIELNGEGELVFREVTYGPWKTDSQNQEESCFCYRCRYNTGERLHPDDFIQAASYVGFVVCDECGNKRCPRASWHGHTCTHSNEPGQKGSNYE